MKKTYKVTSRNRQLGHKPGSQFTAELRPELEERLVNRGAIAVLSEGERKAANTPGGSAGTSEGTDTGKQTSGTSTGAEKGAKAKEDNKR